MAEMVVSASVGVMKPLLAKLTTLMGDEYKKLKDVRKEVVFLVDELSAMEAFLEKMADADKLDPQAKNWRNHVREMAYDIEDCIDDFMHHLGGANDKLGFLQKAVSYIKTWMDRPRITNQMVQIQEIKARVIQASDRRKRYKLDECITNSSSVDVDPRLSALYKESASLVGIDGPREELIEWVTDEGQQLKVVSIVGFGGLGKTTLANEVYRKIGGHFNCKAFVSVSLRPDMTRLLNALLSQLGLQPSHHACDVQDLINNLREYLHHKRFSSRPASSAIAAASITAFPARHRRRVHRLLAVAPPPAPTITDMRAKKPIMADEGFTYNFRFPLDDKKIACLCGSKRCRGFMN